jgi:hypothetical protein
VQFRLTRYAESIDTLIEKEDLRSPDHIKIDVDGNELFIINGMRRLLSREFGAWPRTIQIEVNVGDQIKTHAAMEAFGYAELSRHYTATGQARIDLGHDPADYPYNVIFTPR